MGLRHIFTRPYRPRTNGTAERFIGTLVEGWADGRVFRDSRERQAALGSWLAFYNRQRPHGGLGGQAPYERLHALTVNNVVGMHI